MAEEIVVFWLTGHDSRCSECEGALGKGNFLRKEGERGLCLSCADLDHLRFLPAGEACITRRASKYSPLRAVVLKWSRTRKRYERQGILVAPEAVARAESECLDDEDVRERRRESDAIRRAERDAEYVTTFASEIVRLYPAAPKGVARAIAEHACEIHSGRIGRTASAKDFDPLAIDLAVQAHVRHCYTDYDERLGSGADREDARAAVRQQVEATLAAWRGKS